MKRNCDKRAVLIRFACRRTENSMITHSYYNDAYMHYMRKNNAMNSDKMTDILQELKKPFHPAHVTWKPGSLTKDQTKALALAYADLRAYQNRLDEICGMAWSVTVRRLTA